MSALPGEPTPPVSKRTNAFTPIVPTLVVLSMCAALSLGIMVRNHVDARGEAGASAAMTGLTASTQKDPSGVNLDAYYDEVGQLLHDKYVDAIDDDNKLAIGAVRGMVTSLGDPHSLYMDKEAFSAYQEALKGKFLGVGVDFEFRATADDVSPADAGASETDPTADLPGSRVPRLVAAAVVPGGPADKAGVKPGDWVDTIDAHWVIDPELITRYRKLAANAKKPEQMAELLALRKSLRDRAESAILPPRALSLLSLGTEGKTTVIWGRAGSPLRTTVLAKTVSIDSGNTAADATVPRLRFGPGATDFLRGVIAHRDAVTLDLRNQPAGAFDTMVRCLALLAPSGDYGGFTTQRPGEKVSPLVVPHGNPNPPKITLLVDGTVRGASEIFALALSRSNLAKLSGQEMGSDRSRVLVEGLPDGSGYTLVTGIYSPTLGAAAKHTQKSKKVKV